MHATEAEWKVNKINTDWEIYEERQELESENQLECLEKKKCRVEIFVIQPRAGINKLSNILLLFCFFSGITKKLVEKKGLRVS